MSDPERIRIFGRAIPVRGNDIDTDRIIPARFLRCLTFDGLGEHAFEDDRASAGDVPHAFDRAEFQGAEILVVGDNFGCGSSREHAPQSLMRWGIRALVGASFAEIFFGNCVALGVPCVVISTEEAAKLQSAIEKDPSIEVTLDISERRLSYSGGSISVELPDGVQQAFVGGTWDSTSLLLESPEEVDEVAGNLPYVSGWTS